MRTAANPKIGMKLKFRCNAGQSLVRKSLPPSAPYLQLLRLSHTSHVSSVHRRSCLLLRQMRRIKDLVRHLGRGHLPFALIRVPGRHLCHLVTLNRRPEDEVVVGPVRQKERV